MPLVAAYGTAIAMAVHKNGIIAPALLSAAAVLAISLPAIRAGEDFPIFDLVALFAIGAVITMVKIPGIDRAYPVLFLLTCAMATIHIAALFFSKKLPVGVPPGEHY